MRAVRFTAYGGPDILKVVQVDKPTPGSGEVLVQVCAAGINRADLITVAGTLKSSLPMTPGRDFAGIIADGPDAGMEVWASGTDFGVTRDGASAEYVAVPRSWLAAKPTNLSMEEAAACCVPFIVAHAALVDAGGIKRDETVLVTGAEGAVGNAAIQIVHLYGARVIGIQQTSHASGADHIVNTKKQDLTEAVRDLTGGRGIDLAFDTVGADLFEPVLKTVKAGGRHVAIASGKHRVEFDLFDFYRSQLTLFGVNTLAFSGERSAAILEALRPAFVSGDLKPPAIRSLPFEEAAAAYGYVNAGGGDRQVMVS